MKHYAYILLFSLVGFVGCDKHEIENYNGVDAIFFDQQRTGQANESWLNEKTFSHQNYTLVNFNTIAEPDSTLSIKIETTGYLRDYERPFSVEIVPDSTEAIQGEEFEILNPNLSILPGENKTYVNVLLHKSPRMNESTLKIQLRLIPGEHFVLPFGPEGIGIMPLRINGSGVNTELGTNTDVTVHDIFVSAMLTQPSFWQRMLPGNISYLGKYSLKKYQIILDLFSEKYGWTALDFESPLMTSGERQYLVNRTLTKYLIEQFNKGKDHMIIDEDGTVMWARNCPWAEGTLPNEI